MEHAAQSSEARDRADPRARAAATLVQALWRYERGREPVGMRMPGRGVVQVDDAAGGGHLVVLAAPARSPLRPAPVDPVAARALGALGWARTFLVWPGDDGRRARILGPSSRWAPARWRGMQDVVAHAGGGELTVWAVTGAAGPPALAMLLPGLRAHLGFGDAPPGTLGARAPDLVRALRDLREADRDAAA